MGSLPSERWYLARGGVVAGPYSADDVRALLAQGHVVPEDLSCREGASEWVRLADVPGWGLQPPPPPPPAPPTLSAPPAPQGVPPARQGPPPTPTGARTPPGATPVPGTVRPAPAPRPSPPPRTAPRDASRPYELALIANLNWVGGVGVACIAAIALFEGFVLAGVLILSWAALKLYAASKLEKPEPGGARAALFDSMLRMPIFPFGTMGAWQAQSYLRRPGIKALFERSPGESWSSEEIEDLEKARTSEASGIRITLLVSSILLAVQWSIAGWVITQQGKAAREAESAESRPSAGASAEPERKAGGKKTHAPAAMSAKMTDRTEKVLTSCAEAMRRHREEKGYLPQTDAQVLIALGTDTWPTDAWGNPLAFATWTMPPRHELTYMTIASPGPDKEFAFQDFSEYSTSKSRNLVDDMAHVVRP